MKHYFLVCLFTLISGFSPYAVAADDQSVSITEQSVPEEEQPDESDTAMLSYGSPVAGYQALTVAGELIDAAYMEESYGQRFGAVVLFHDEGEQFESSGVITPLRHYLPRYGWSTLTVSLDLPVEANIMLSASMEEADKQEGASPKAKSATDEGEELGQSEPGKNSLPVISNEQRISAALEFLQSKGVEQVIFVGHGVGGNVAIRFIDTSPVVAGIILVATPAQETAEELESLVLPTLDIYGSNDLEGIEQAVLDRKILMKRNENSAYVMRKIIGANHVFYGLATALENTVRGWLKVNFQQEVE